MASSSHPLPILTHPPSHWRYDVFLSFRGLDTRNNFTSHLYSALVYKGINTYKDDKELERGKTIEPNLWKAIEESMFSIVIFSNDYASSPWCLDELVKIIDCMKTKGQTVLPIFYNVDPSDVADKKGSYEKAFRRYEEEFKDSKEKVKTWKDALTDAANLSGWDVRCRDQSKIIKEIVERVWYDVSNTLLISDKTLVGMDFHIKEMKRLLGEDRLMDVQFIGICGMGGIGKTTIAEVVYDRIYWQFEVSCFLANVKEAFKDNHGVISLQNQILSQITRKQSTKIHDFKTGSLEIRRSLKNKKILLIVDDVDDLKQLEMFVGKRNWFGIGSRVIITSRDRHLLSTHEVDAIHEVDVLNNDDALELFSRKAFTREQPSKDYLELSKLVLAHAKGLPLALSILGSFLNGRSLNEWRSAIDKLDRVPDNKIIEVLRISFDTLEDSYKQIFLDIACCFRGEKKDRVTSILDACGLYPHIGLQVLIERSLISNTKDDKIQMHDLIQVMGRYIVKEKSRNDPERLSRLWDLKDIRQVNTMENKVEVLVLLGEHDWGTSSSDFEVLSRLNNLRILKIQTSRVPWGGVPTHLSNELRYFKWSFYPFRSLPSSFQPNKLVQLRLSYSNIEQLWYGSKVLNCLKTLHLKRCDNLVETPDFTGTPNLETLEIVFCKKLSKLHPSMLKLKRLIKLVLRDCGNLEELGSSIEMESLQILDLSYCSNLRTLPNSIQNLVSLVSLKLHSCYSLWSLPSTIVRLKALKEIELVGCSNLNELPEDICQLMSLKSLDLRSTGIRQLPQSIFVLKNLEELCFEGKMSLSLFLKKVKEPEVLMISSLSGLASLKKLELIRCYLSDGSIPDDIGCLSRLTYLDLTGNNFISLPRSVSQLNELEEFILQDCRMLKKLPEIPPNLSILSLNGCVALEELPNSIKLQGSKISAFHCFDCIKLYQNNGGHRIASKMIQQYIKDLSNPANPGSGLDTIVPGEKVPRWFSRQAEGRSVAVTTPTDMLCGSNSGLLGFAACVLLKVSASSGTQSLRCRIESTTDKNELIRLKDYQPQSYNKSMYIARSYNCWSFYVSFHQFEELKDKSISHLLLTFCPDNPYTEIRRCSVRLISFQDIQEFRMEDNISFYEDYDIDAVYNDSEESSGMSDVGTCIEFKTDGDISSCEDYGIDVVEANENEESSDLYELGSYHYYYGRHSTPGFSQELKRDTDSHEAQTDVTEDSFDLREGSSYEDYHRHPGFLQESNMDDVISSGEGFETSTDLKIHVTLPLISVIFVLLALLKQFS